MAKKQKHYFVNWIDGMKINKDHFIGMENAMIYQQNTAGRLLVNPFNFGIFPSADGEPNLDISFRIETNNKVSVRVNRCRAITSGGILIDLDTGSEGLSEFDVSIDDFDLQSAESNSGSYYIVLKTDPYNRVPAGDSDAAENPPRHPYALPDYSVFLVPVEQMNKAGFGDYFLVIGKLYIRDNIPTLDKEYIPPCTSVSSDRQLLDLENRLVGFFSRLELDLTTIIRKIHIKQQKTPLANSVLFMAEKLGPFQALEMTHQRLYLKHSPPVALYETISRFACYLRNILNTLPPESKEELINYFSDWCNLRQGEFEKLLTDTPTHNYDHHEIKEVMTKMISFIDTTSVLFETLGNLDYIGKRRETQIYIKEETKPKKSFLADD